MAAGKIFNHDISRWVPDSYTGRELYSSRVLGISSPEDVVQLPPETKPMWQDIASHYARIGLAHSLNPVWDLSLKTIQENPGRDLSIFLFDDVLCHSSSDTNWFSSFDPEWFKCVRFINSKNNFITLAEKMGIPVPLTTSADNRSQLDLSPVSYPCYLKPAVSGNGAGIVRCASARKLEKALEKVSPEMPLQIQAEVKADCFINLQYTASGGKFRRLAATQQILDRFVYSGSSYPTIFQPWDLMDPMAEWLATRGMKGLFAFDLAVIKDRAYPRYQALECNPRFNGASYPSIIARKLGIEAWSCETFSTGYRNLQDIRLTDIEFNPSTGEGIILITWGTVMAGKLGILLAGPKKAQDRLRMKLKKIL